MKGNEEVNTVAWSAINSTTIMNYLLFKSLWLMVNDIRGDIDAYTA